MSIEAWDEIRTAYQVARLGTVSGAADVLGVHHATVIRHIDALEKRLGTKLFQRHARGYTATEAGRDLLTTAQRTEEQLSQLVGRIRGQGETVSGELIVTSISGIAQILTPVFKAFAEAHPDVTIKHISDMRLFRLDFGEAHVAIRAGAAPEDPDCVVQPLVRMGTGLFASPDYVATHGPIDGPQDFLRHRFIGPVDPGSRPGFYRWMRTNIPEQRILHRVSEPEAKASAVTGGLGVGFMPRREGLAAGMIEMVPSQPGWDSALWIVTHVDLHRTLKVQSFLTVLKRMAANWTCA
jgi:DNA-binding transcriptional LysR family regulator